MIKTFSVGDQVKVRLSSGIYVEGRIKTASYMNINGKMTVQYGVLIGEAILDYFKPEELELIEQPIKKSCNCGSTKLNHPGHSHWCDLA